MTNNQKELLKLEDVAISVYESWHDEDLKSTYFSYLIQNKLDKTVIDSIAVYTGDDFLEFKCKDLFYEIENNLQNYLNKIEITDCSELMQYLYLASLNASDPMYFLDHEEWGDLLISERFKMVDLNDLSEEITRLGLDTLVEIGLNDCVVTCYGDFKTMFRITNLDYTFKSDSVDYEITNQ